MNMATEHNYKFESLADLIAAKHLPHANPQSANNNRGYLVNPGRGEPNWMCADRPVYSHADVESHLAAQTFEPGVRRVERLSSQITAPTPKNRRRKPARADSGDELDMGRVWQGDLERAWRTTRREQSVGPSRVLIVVQINASYNTPSEELACRGAAALALASVLRESGYTVSIVAVSHNTLLDGHRTPYNAEITVLAPDQELDLHKLASILASSLVFRGVIVDHEQRVSEHPVEPGTSMSRDLDITEIDTTGYDMVATLDKNTVTSRETAAVWLKQQLAKLCGEDCAEG